MAKKVNKKKIVSICPVGMIKTRCPSIRRTRQIRVKLLTLQRERNIDTDQITKLRSALKIKKNKGIAVDCETCSFNTKGSHGIALNPIAVRTRHAESDPAATCWVFLWLAFRLFAGCCAGVLCAPEATAQVRTYEVGTLRFEGNDSFGDGILEDLIQTRETSGAFMRFLHDNITEKLGGRPEYFEASIFDADILRLRNFYRDNGFFHATVDTSVVFDEQVSRVHITVRFHEGKASFVDTLRTKGFDDLPSILQEELDEDPKIQVGDRYSATAVETELVRIRTAFGNHGYRAAHIAPVEAFRYASTNNITLVITVERGPRSRFGSIEIVVDTTAREQVEPTIVLNHLDFTEGEDYSEGKKNESERNLNTESMLVGIQVDASNYPTAFANWLQVMFTSANPLHEVVILGDMEHSITKQMIEMLWSKYRPDCLVSILPPSPPPNSPAVGYDRQLVNNLPTAFVCHNFVCEYPTNDADELACRIA